MDKTIVVWLHAALRPVHCYCNHLQCYSQQITKCINMTQTKYVVDCKSRLVAKEA